MYISLSIIVITILLNAKIPIITSVYFKFNLDLSYVDVELFEFNS